MTASGLSADVLASIRKGFFEECEDLLAELEAGLTALRDGARGADVVNSVFRAVHSIKGGAAAFDLAALVAFSHRFEGTLDTVRGEVTAADPALFRLLLEASDALADLVRAARDGTEPDAARLERIGRALDDRTPADPAPADEFDWLRRPGADEEGGVERCWTIRFRPRPGLYAKANEPMLLLRELGRLGEAETSLDEHDLPLLPDLDPEAAYLGWTIRLRTTASEAEIRDVFLFVEGDCDLELIRGNDVAAALVSPPDPGAAEMGEAGAGVPGRTLRVDLDRIDRLVNLVGELVINQSMLAQRVTEGAQGGAVGMEQPLDELAQLTRDLQDSVMAIRAQPVRVVFQRLSRLVREAEAATGKAVALVMEGEATEVDRTVIERLTDPLTHMIRNAVAHGIEPPAERLALGKPAQGTLRISAAHRAGRIVIEVADDGRGLDRGRVRALAAERGLIAADAALADEEVDNLIFAPGFSTARSVSSLSGRGVGLDVVKSGVQALGGRVAVASRPGEGTTFTLSLPLTLAVMDGMVVQVAGHSLVAPLTTLVESVQPRPDDVRALGAGGRLLSFRGEHLPLLDLGMALGYRDAPQDPCARVVVVVEDDLGRRAALVVEEILGQRQVVMKSLEANYGPVEGVSAATILGDGRVALILDVSAIIASHRGGENRPAQRRRATG